MKLLNTRYTVLMLTIVLCFLFSATKIYAQWGELGGTNGLAVNNSIEDIITDTSGNVYACGAFSNANGNIEVVKWDRISNNWGELGDTKIYCSNNVDSSCIVTSLAVDANGNVYAFGNSSYLVNGILIKWDKMSNTWIDIHYNSSFNNLVYVAPKGTLYTEGMLKDSANNYVLIFDSITNTWGELGKSDTLFDYIDIASITTDTSGNIYAAGTITGTEDFVAEWNKKTNSWSKVGGNSLAANSDIFSIAVDAIGNIYAGGDFTNTKGKQYVAKWDRTTNVWSELGGFNSLAANGDIQSIVIDAAGNVYAAGYFTNSTGWFYVAKWDKVTNTWSELGGINSLAANGPIISITTDSDSKVYAAGVFTNASRKAYVAVYTPKGLPVTISSFSATTYNKTIQTNWHTATEINTSHFIIQHSTDGSSFTDIGTVKAIGSGANGYQFTDNSPTNGINYYRLESVDKDGASTFSKVVSCEIVDSRYEIVVVPNPVRDVATIKGSHIASVQVIDNMGRVVSVQALHDATNPSISVSSLPAGVYHLRVQTTDGKVSGVGMVKE